MIKSTKGPNAKSDADSTKPGTSLSKTLNPQASDKLLETTKELKPRKVTMRLYEAKKAKIANE